MPYAWVRWSLLYDFYRRLAWLITETARKIGDSLSAECGLSLAFAREIGAFRAILAYIEDIYKILALIILKKDIISIIIIFECLDNTFYERV